MRPPGQEPRTAAEVRGAVDDVLARREFQEERSMLEDFLEWLQARLDMGQGSRVLGEILFWLLLTVLAALTIYLGGRFLAAGRQRRRQRDAAAGAHGPDVAQRVGQLRREAEQALASGELRLALRKNLFALILGLGGRGDLEYRDAWTNRELFERGETGAEVARTLRPLVGELDAMSFGRVPVTRDDVRRFETLGERLLGGPVR